jgi:diacylglycerol kinase family enzyme
MDGELADLAAVTRLRIRPGALKVLVPAAEGE